MNNTTKKALLYVTAATLALAGLGIATPAEAQYPVDHAPDTSDGVSESDLLLLAPVFNEVPGSISTGDHTAGALGETTCGQSGHCSYVSCPEPQCEAGKSPSCKCTASDVKCKDKHDWYNPFDDDEHNMYDCSCTCVGEGSEDDCIITWPVKICKPGAGVPGTPPVAVPECVETRTNVPDFGALQLLCDTLEKARQTADGGP